MSTEEESVTVYSDYVCPFCYLGRRSLDEYQRTREDDLEVDWHPFDLRGQQRGPDGEIDHSIENGKDETYYEQARQNVERLQEEYGVEMTMDIAEDVDSLDAQVLSYHVKREYPYDTWLAFDEAVLDALWQDGRDIGDRDVLLDVAAEVGIEEADVRSALDDEELHEEIHERFDEAQRAGISGVPTFAYEGYAARGAVPPEQLRRLIEGQ